MFLLSGVQLKLGYTPKMAQVSCWSFERSSYTGHSSPVARFCRYNTDFNLIRFTKASNLPSGDICGRQAPPVPPVTVSIAPVSRFNRLMAYMPWLGSLLYWKNGPGVTSSL